MICVESGDGKTLMVEDLGLSVKATWKCGQSQDKIYGTGIMDVEGIWMPRVC
jgi:hypothetical protein